jgi:TM2 domain-containing membrane protein YozV
MRSPERNQRLLLSYLLWFAGFFGVSDLHRLYNGKIVTGLIWLSTFGLFGVGQFIDVFFVPGMAEEKQLKRLKTQLGDRFYDSISFSTLPSDDVVRREKKMVALLQAAQRQGGHLSVTQGVMATGMGFEEVESLLNSMAKSSYVGIENHPETGIVLYRFDELLV